MFHLRPNARFWVWINGGYVKITLQPGKSLEHHKRWTHDEGWSSETVRWSHEPYGIYRRTWTDGRDCDGRLSTYDVDRARLSQLDAQNQNQIICVTCGNQATNWFDHKGQYGWSLTCSQRHHQGITEIENPRTPLWEDLASSQRDYAAEAMNY